MVDAFCFFSWFSGLKPNFKKSELAVIRVLIGLQVAVCGLRCIDQKKNSTLQTLGIYFSYNEKLNEEK